MRPSRGAAAFSRSVAARAKTQCIWRAAVSTCSRPIPRCRWSGWPPQGRARRLRASHPVSLRADGAARRRARRRNVRRCVLELRRGQLRAAARRGRRRSRARCSSPARRSFGWSWADTCRGNGPGFSRAAMAKGFPSQPQARQRCGEACTFPIRRRRRSRARLGRTLRPSAGALGRGAAADLRFGLARALAAHALQARAPRVRAAALPAARRRCGSLHLRGAATARARRCLTLAARHAVSQRALQFALRDLRLLAPWRSGRDTRVG